MSETRVHIGDVNKRQKDNVACLSKSEVIFICIKYIFETLLSFINFYFKFLILLFDYLVLMMMEEFNGQQLIYKFRNRSHDSYWHSAGCYSFCSASS